MPLTFKHPLSLLYLHPLNLFAYLKTSIQIERLFSSNILFLKIYQNILSFNVVCKNSGLSPLTQLFVMSFMMKLDKREERSV